MGTTHVIAKVFGESETREYSFLADTGSTYIALPLEEIEALGLRQGLGRIKFMSATGIVEVDTYFADGELMGQEFSALLVPASTPLIGCELLENLRFKVNPVTRQLERVPDSEWNGPYLV